MGNIFKLKEKFTKAFDLKFRGKDGKEKMVLMGCYGIGLGRLMGTVAEIHHDEKGIVWPKEVAPYQAHLIEIQGEKRKAKNIAEKLYKDLLGQGIEVLYDDREDKTAGEKFADADLIGIPTRIVISERTLEKNCAEVKQRDKKEIKLVKLTKLSQDAQKNIQ